MSGPQACWLSELASQHTSLKGIKSKQNVFPKLGSQVRLQRDTLRMGRGRKVLLKVLVRTQDSDSSHLVCLEFVWGTGDGAHTPTHAGQAAHP